MTDTSGRSIQEHYCIGLISDNSFTLLKKFSASQIFGAKPVFVCMCAPCLKMTTKGKAVKSVIYISSSDEDEEDTPPSKARLPYKVKKEKVSNGIVKKTETVILSSDDELEKTPQKISRPSFVKEEPDFQVSTSKAQNETSPWKSLKFKQNNIKILQAKVRLQKLNFGNLSNASIDKTENHDVMPVPTASCSKSQGEMAKDESEVSCRQVPGMGIFESIESRFPSTQLKRSKSPSSPSLKQTVITQESFSPPKKPSLYRCMRQEQPLHYSTPLWCSVQMQGPQMDSSKDFTENQMNSLQALKEENFHKTYLHTVTNFMSQSRKPPVGVLFHILHNILLSKQNNCGNECFRILRQIQVLHPVMAMKMVNLKISWEHISMMVELSRCTDDMSQESSQALSASMALSFVVNVMEEEVNVKRFSLVKTSGYRLLSVKHFSTHIFDLVQWIGDATKHPQKTKNLFLLQRMLTLSLSVNERPEDFAGRIADELFLVYNWQLHTTKEKSLLLQSTQSHLLRMKLIEVILSNCFPPQEEQDIREVPRMGLAHIIFVDFQRSPDTNNSDHVDLIDHCEVFIMLLAYLLQSFLFCRKRSLQKNSSDSLRIMSMDDTDSLLEIDSEVTRLKERLENICSPSQLSSRSYQLLDLMSSLKTFAQKLP